MNVTHPKLDIIIPVYNEQDVVQQFHQQLVNVVKDLPYEVIIYYVNDGSTDDTTDILSQMVIQDKRVVVVELSRNFGHQSALTAGLDLADGDIVITMDSDGQHPPDLIPQLINLYEMGYDVVQAQRLDNQRLSFMKRISSKAFYWLINKLGSTRVIPGTADYRLMTRKVVQSLQNMREYHRFLRGMIPWMGYRTVILPFLPPDRMAGKSKYSARKMMKLALDAIFSFSLIPLQIGFVVGLLFYLLALAEAVYVLSFWFQGRQEELVRGWSSIVFLILITGGSLMISLGLIGMYIGYIYESVKQRPIYFIRDVLSNSSNKR